MEAATTQRLEQILAKAAEGDQAAFGQIVREHQSMVFSLVFHFVQNRALADELSQEVFIRLYQNLGSIKSPAHLLHWLRKVTSRRCIDESRRGSAQRQVSLDEVAEPSAPAPASDPLLAERLRRLVGSLPKDFRMVVILRYQEELELAEIADVLQIPINTVKSRLQRALATLREKLSVVMGTSQHG